MKTPKREGCKNMSDEKGMTLVDANDTRFIGCDVHGNKRYIGLCFCKKCGYKGTIQEVLKHHC